MPNNELLEGVVVLEEFTKVSPTHIYIVILILIIIIVDAGIGCNIVCQAL